MARRSPQNPRYQKDQTPKGQTRKSAASAKPVRDSGATSSSGKNKEKKSFKERYAETTPQTPEYKKYRKHWWIALGLGASALGISMIISYIKPIEEALGQNGQIVSLALTLISLVAIAYAWYVDLRKIRPEMKRFSESNKGKK